ncbi:hypothetical protein [Rubellicoccus peritrichatus]|uniref:Uncharacterized protein n=1 Tax=Rubellicoccus peritrichatus TaxID=3080537 RepID=A0AAQ3L952_9BACT|nr:hypothetical protein [Puniceicoccus sp. CR14]WOO40932.1 hypothetical protein RZN69_20105 [Puniceicoccus sp. CR14]
MFINIPRINISIATSLVLILLTLNNLNAAIWDSGGSNDLWSTAQNWSGDTIPDLANSAWLNTAGDFAQIDANTTAEAFQLIVARHSGATGITLEMTGGTLTTGNVLFVGQYAGSNGTLLMSGGTINAGTELAIAVTGAGSLVMTGGTINVATSFKIGRYSNATAVGQVTLHGGSINCLSFGMNTYSSLDFANGGVLIIDGNESSNVNSHVAAGRITAAGGSGTVDVDYNVTNAGKTTVTTTATVSSTVSNPVPANGAQEISILSDLSWSAGSGASFDVYIGTTFSAVQNATVSSPEYLGTSNGPSADLSNLDRDSVYYWRVDELDGSNQVISTGPVWSFTTKAFDINDLGTMTVNYDFTDVRTITPAPASGVHPRIFFNQSDVADIKSRLQNTNSGQEVSAQIDAYMTLMELGYDGGCSTGKYCRSAPYALDSQGRARISNPGLFNIKSTYDDLVSGASDPLAGTDATRRILLCGMMAIRAFDALIDDNTTVLAEVGTAIANCAPELDVYGNDFQCYVHLAYAYDMAYNQMTSAQRSTVVQELADHLEGYIHYGTYEEAYASTSNWTTLNSFYPLTYMAIEGESPQLDAIAYEGAVRATYNFLTYGWYPTGAGYEGLGKNYVFATSLIAFAKRGQSYLGHPHLRAYAEKFLPALIQPFGYAFSGYDSLAGSGRKPDPINALFWKPNAQDVIGLKWAFPNSPEVDFVWRNYIGDDYDYRPLEPRGYDNPLLVAAIFCSDIADTSNWDSSIVPLTYFAGDRGLMHTRSDTTENAMSLEFHCRQDFGGHTNADRLNFNLSALGRVWGCYRTEVNGGPTGNPHEMKYHSCILIDDKGVQVNSKDGVKARQPGSVIDFSDQSDITSVTGDATYAYTWEYNWNANVMGAPDSNLNNGWTMVEETLNDFRYTPGTEPFHDIRFYDYASWHTFPFVERMVKRPWLPMSYIYRKASLVRGVSPYALIIDDVALSDGQSHNYKWQMQIPDDLEIDYTDVNFVNSDYRNDIVLKEPTAAGNRRLLVRVLQNDGYTGTSGYILNRIEPRNEVDNWPALVVEANTASTPNFKVLIYAFNVGDSLPVTSWNGNQLTVQIGSQTDTYNMSVTNGRTDFTFVRGPQVPATTLVWNDDASDSLWSSGDNWNQDFAPRIIDDAWVNTTGDYVNVSNGVDALAKDFILARHDGKTGISMDVSGGTVTTSNVFFIGQYGTAHGTLNLSAGTVTAGSEMAVAVSGKGTMSMTGGTVNVATNFKIGRYNIASAIGHLDLHGGTISCNYFSINDYSDMDITTGTLIINGNRVSSINTLINNNRITAYGGSGTVQVDYNNLNPGKTTVTATSN